MPIIFGDLDGADELMAALRRKTQNVRRESGAALTAGAEVLRTEVERRCPRDESARNLSKKYSPGQHLADNIIISEVKEDFVGNQYVEVGPTRGDNNDFFYGKFLEFGTTKMSQAKPFVEPAYRAKKSAVLKKMAEVVRRVIEGD